MMKVKMTILLVFLLCFGLVSCRSSTSSTYSIPIEVDDYDYNALSFPDYLQMNPVRYLDEGYKGLFNGWQDFGLTGELQTKPWPQTTPSYQNYSYFIRSNLQEMYKNVDLPTTITELPIWLTQTKQHGHRILWFSMMERTLPDHIDWTSYSTIQNRDKNQSFIRVHYNVYVGETRTQWILYLMEVDGVYSSFAIRVNESYDMSLTIGEIIIKSYQPKATPTT